MKSVFLFWLVSLLGVALSGCEASSGTGGFSGSNPSTPPSSATSTPTSSTTVTDAPPASGEPSAGLGTTAQGILSLASRSSCARYAWSGRGRAPAGYIEGMALSFARSQCRLLGHSSLSSAAQVMAEANTGQTASDALAYYGINAPSAGEDALVSVYTLGMGLGMRESSGEYCTGWDTTAGSNRSSSQAEAGLFQFSYDSIGVSPELQALYDEYRADPTRCLLPTFSQGVSCTSQGILGTGAGADFQSFTKSCPAFAAEYAMVMLRVIRSHFGTIIRKEAEYVSSCVSLLTEIRSEVDSNPTATCRDLQASSSI